MSLEDFLKWMGRRGATLMVREESGHTVLHLKCPCGGELAHNGRAVDQLALSNSVVPLLTTQIEEMMRGLDNLIRERAWPTKSI
jgi:hypothetical protein